MQQVIREKAKELLSSGKVDRILAWQDGEFFYDQMPCIFKTPEEIDKSLVYNGFSSVIFQYLWMMGGNKLEYKK